MSAYVTITPDSPRVPIPQAHRVLRNQDFAPSLWVRWRAPVAGESVLCVSLGAGKQSGAASG
jgi:hypothetical protein